MTCPRNSDQQSQYHLLGLDLNVFLAVKGAPLMGVLNAFVLQVHYIYLPCSFMGKHLESSNLQNYQLTEGQWWLFVLRLLENISYQCIRLQYMSCVIDSRSLFFSFSFALIIKQQAECIGLHRLHKITEEFHPPIHPMMTSNLVKCKNFDLPKALFLPWK